MRKLLFILFLILLINAVNAQEINFNIFRDSYTAKETLQAELILNINPVNKITESNFILTNQNNNIIPIPLFLEKISENNYFVYFNVPELNSGVYNFQVNDIRYIDQEELKQISVKKTFTLLNSSQDNTSISINPGIILNDRKLEIINNLEPINIIIETPDFVNLSREVLLKDKLILNIKIYEKDYNIKIIYNNKQYTIPVLNLNKNLADIILKPPKGAIIFLNSSQGIIFPKEINLEKEITIYNPFYIKNTWNFDIYNLNLTVIGNLKGILKLDKNIIQSIKPNETIQVNAIINQGKNPLINNYKGSVIISNQDIISYLNLNVNFILKQEKNITKNETVFKIINLTNQTQIYKQVKKKTASNFIKVFIIILILVLIIYFIFKMKITKKESFEEIYKFKKR